MSTNKNDYYHLGLTDDEVLQSREKNGINLLTPPKRPFRITFTNVSSLTAFSRSNFLLASYSKKKPIPVASKIAAIIPIVSAYSFSMIEMINEMDVCKKFPAKT